MLLTWLIVALQVLACVSAAPSTPRQSTLDVGTGIYDVTGPVGGVNFMVGGLRAAASPYEDHAVTTIHA